MVYDAKLDWSSIHKRQSNLAYPAEGVIRIFKGAYPGLHMPKPNYGNILDLGCGDGRHFPLFQEIGLSAFGTEISDELCLRVRENLREHNVHFADIQTGTTNQIPFQSVSFDFLLSWNSCYYMTAGGEMEFENHVFEMARVLKMGGWLICSIPKNTNFIYKNSRLLKNKYRILAKDPWGFREGEILKCFESKSEIESEFGKLFVDFCHADIDMDWFGLNYHWHIFVAKRK